MKWINVSISRMNIIKWGVGFLHYAVISGAVLHIIVYVTIAVIRLQYPYELEWMEGGMVDHVNRVLSGQKLYVSPSLDFVPYLYPPLFFYISAIVSKIMGLGFEPLRLVSFISSIGIFLVIFLIVNRETGSKFAAILASGLFAATFRIGGSWFDIGRVDSLALLLLLLGVYLIRFHTSPLIYISAGVILSLSFLTKQSALFVIVPMMVYCLLLDWRRSTYFIFTIVVVLGGSILALDYIHDGWFSYYVFELPRQHTIIQSRVLGFWRNDLLQLLPIAITMAIFYLVSQLLDSNRSSILFYALFAAGMFGGSWLIWIQAGSHNNVLIPAYTATSILFGLAIHTLFQFFQSESI